MGDVKCVFHDEPLSVYRVRKIRFFAEAQSAQRVKINAL
jgi:hypothetical protein